MAHHHRHLGLIGMLFASIGGILGSGWLFGPLYAVQLAGPAALIAWLIGGFAILIIALTFAELSASLPLNGGITRHTLVAYGRTSGFLVSLAGWLTFTVIVAAEVQAVMQYASIHWTWLTVPADDGSHPLTKWGFLVAAVLWLLFSFITWIGVRLFARVNGVLTWIKVGLILVVTVSLYVLAFEWTLFDDLKEGGFAPEGWDGIFRALAYGGVIYAFTGFQHAAVAAGESRNPHRDVPIAVIGSILVCTVLYLAIQIAFIGAMRESAMPHGWAQLSFKGQVGPLAGLAMTLGVTWLFILIFAGAIASPLGAGLINLGSSARIAQGMSHDSYLPRRLGKVGRFHTPGLILVLSFPVGLFLFLPFPGWQDLVAFLASVVVVSYAAGPISLLALRRQLPDQARPFRLPFAHVICPLAFIICGLLIYWAGWPIVWKLGVTFGVCGVLFVLVKLPRKEPIDFMASLWIWPFLAGLVVLAWLGGHGGAELIPFGWDIVAVAGWSLACYLLALPLAIRPENAQAYLDGIHAARDEAHQEIADFGG
ncbi:MAG: APC family permease [Phycisphaerales bacterium]|nr:APC family permease [Phycisphaerales bacterium]